MDTRDCVIYQDYLTEVPEGTNDQKRTWFFQTKFETPILNFANVSYTQTATSSVTSVGGLTNAQNIKINGMWHQYGSQITSSNEGVFMRIRQDADARTNQLADILGFDAGLPARIGKPKEANMLEEAVVIVPFRVENNRRKFFEMDKEHQEYDITQRMLKKYVFPPKFDTIVNPETGCNILMYVFEFSQQVTQQDITDMWQNLPPSIGEKFERKEKVIDDKQILDLITCNSNEIRWMVFKVKKRAAKDYDKFRRSLISNDVSGFSQTVGKYSYNWPYDYFSLVELVKLDETVQYASKDLLDDET